MATIAELQTKPQSTILVVLHGENRTKWYLTQDGDLLTQSEAENADDLTHKVMADDWFLGTLEEWRKSVKDRVDGIRNGYYDPMMAGIELIDL